MFNAYTTLKRAVYDATATSEYAANSWSIIGNNFQRLLWRSPFEHAIDIKLPAEITGDDHNLVLTGNQFGCPLMKMNDTIILREADANKVADAIIDGNTFYLNAAKFAVATDPASCPTLVNIGTNYINTGETQLVDNCSGLMTAAASAYASSCPCTVHADCDDGNACTDDICNNGACQNSNDDTNTCDDGNDCTSGDACSAGACAGTNVTNGTSCNDNDACTSTDQCTDGVCGGTDVVCDDSNPKTVDTCNGGVCEYAYVEYTTCDDSNACTQRDVYIDGVCTGLDPVVCTTTDSCSPQVCNQSTGVCEADTQLGDGTSCDDGNPCTTNGTCSSGVCSGATALSSGTACDDGNPCTDESCDGSGSCASTNDDSNTCDDSNPCTSTDSCQSGECVGTSVADGTACDDGNSCTTGEACLSGKCIDSTYGECLVLVSANDEACIPQPVTDGVACGHANACSVGACSAGVCTYSATTACDDSDSCTSDSCDPVLGCVNELICDDSDPCTQDTCTDGVCGTAIPAVEGSPCMASGDAPGYCHYGECVTDDGSKAFGVDDFGIEYLSGRASQPYIDEQLVSIVSPFSGEIVLNKNDMGMKGRGLDFVFQRFYRSGVARKDVSMLGDWDASPNEYMIMEDGGSSYAYYLPGGRRIELVKVDDTPDTWVAVNNGFDGIVQAGQISIPDAPSACTTTAIRDSRSSTAVNVLWVRMPNGLRKAFVNMENFSTDNGTANIYRLRLLRDTSGNQLEYHYETLTSSETRLWCVVDTMQRPFEFLYETGNQTRRIDGIKDVGDREIRYQYDLDNNLVAVLHQDPESDGTEFYDYERYGHSHPVFPSLLTSIQTISDIEANRTNSQMFTYDTDGKLATWYVPDSNDVFGHYDLTYSNTGSLATDWNAVAYSVTMTDPDGAETQYGYNGVGLVVRRSVELELPASLPSISGIGATESEIVQTQKWDNEGNIVEVVKPEGNKYEYTYDNPVTTGTTHSAVVQYWTANWWKRLGTRKVLSEKLVAGVRGNGLGSSMSDAVVNYVYEPLYGNLYKKTDAAGNVRISSFDYQECSQSNATTAFATEITLPSGVQMAFPSGMAFSAGDLNGDGVDCTVRGLVVKNDMGTVVNQGTSTDLIKKFQYDAYGRIEGVFDGRGALTTYEYGNLPFSDSSTVGQGYLNKTTLDAAYTGRPITIPARDELTTVAYSNDGLLTSKTMADGYVENYTYNPWSKYKTHVKKIFTDQTEINISTVLSLQGTPQVVYYNPQIVLNNGISTTVAPGESRYEYDAMGNVTKRCKKVSDDEEACYTYTYNSAGQKIEMQSPEGVVTEYIYDSFGRLCVTKRGSGNDQIVVYRYHDANGNMVSRREGVDNNNDGYSDGTVWKYDGKDRIVKHLYEDGSELRRVLSPTNKILQEQNLDDQGGVLSKKDYTYDEFGRRIAATMPIYNNGSLVDSLTWNYEYDESNHLVKVTYPEGVSAHRTLDGGGRIHRIWDDVGNEVEYTYDSVGRVTVADITKAYTPPGGSTVTEEYRTEFAYNGFNKVSERRLVSVATPTNKIIETFEYDSLGNLEEYTDGEGNVTTFMRDGRGKVIRREKAVVSTGDTDNKIVSCSQYDLDGRLVARYADGPDLPEDPDRPAFLVGCADTPNIERQFNTAGKPKKVIYADGTYKEFTYNQGAQVTSIRDRNGSVITNTFDARERLIARSIARGTGVLGSTSETYTYDGVGRLLTAFANNDPNNQNDNVNVQRVYDSAGRLLSETVDEGGTGDTVSYTYDDRFLSQLGYPSGRALNKTFDDYGRPTDFRYTNETNPAVSYGWLGSSLKHEVLGNDVTADYDYDDFQRMSTVFSETGGGTDVTWFEYTYNDVHRITEEARILESPNPNDPKGDRITLDDANRVTEVNHDALLSDPLDMGAWSELYDYDGKNNFVTQTINGLVFNLVSNDLDQYTQRTETGSGDVEYYSYDNNGNMVERSNPPVSKTYDYNFRNQLVKYTDSDAELTVEYTYDALGRRRTKEATVRSGLYLVSTSDTVYNYDGWNKIEEHCVDVTYLPSQFTLTTDKVYVNGYRMDRPVRMDVTTLPGTGVDDVYYYHYDKTGNVVALTTDQGVIKERYKYGAYGNVSVTVLNGTRSVNTIMFKGMDYDDDLQLYDSRMRLYDIELGRFISVDPIGVWGDPANFGNGYGFLGQNPYYGWDPLGLEETATEEEWQQHWQDEMNRACSTGNDKKSGDIGYCRGVALMWALHAADDNTYDTTVGGDIEDDDVADEDTEIVDPDEGQEPPVGGDVEDDEGGEEGEEGNDDCSNGGCQSEEPTKEETNTDETKHPLPGSDCVDFFHRLWLENQVGLEYSDDGSRDNDGTTDEYIDGVKVGFDGVFNPPNSNGDNDGSLGTITRDDTGLIWISTGPGPYNGYEDPNAGMTRAEVIFYSKLNDGVIGPSRTSLKR